MKKLILVASIALSFHSSKALITRVDVLANPKQNVYLLSDWHLDILGAKKTIEQHTDILNILKQFAKAAPVPLIVEDALTIQKQLYIDSELPLSVGGKDDESLNEFPKTIKEFYLEIVNWNFHQCGKPGKYHCEFSPMHYLSHFAKQLPEVIVHNIEIVTHIIHSTFVSLAKDKIADSSYFNYNDSIAIESFLKYIDQLNPIFASTKSFLREKVESLKEINDQETFIKDMNIIRAYLVDALIADRLSKSQDQPFVFIVAGATHIENIKAFLIEDVGYKLVNSFGITYEESRELDRDENCGNLIAEKALDLKATFEEIRPTHNSYSSQFINYITTLANRFLNPFEKATE